MFRERITDKAASPPADIARKQAWIRSMDQYHKCYRRSVEDPEGFWAVMAEDFYWHRKWSTVRSFDFKNDIEIKFYDGAQTSIVYNAVDRQVEGDRKDKVALIWEGNEPGETRKFTYAELKDRSSRFANVLKSKGVKKGDRVCIFMPMIPELVISMLASARIGAIHSVVFAGFSAGSLADRILDSGCSLLITADGVFRGKKHVNLKEISDQALEIVAEHGTHVPHTIVCRRLGASRPVNMEAGRDEWWHDLMADSSADCPVEWMDAEDPLFILYTSGSTGKPKGVLHTTAGYMVYAAKTFKHVFDYHETDVFWCTADIGWITGHTYIVYGPLLNGATTVMFEGIPTYPDAGRFWDIVDLHKVSIFYTAPTAIRALARGGDRHVNSRNLDSLRLLGTVGEPINPKAWQWYHRVVGKGRLPIVDTWWQTETGGVMISPLPGATPLKPGSATLPYFGVVPVLLDDRGEEVQGAGTGVLCLRQPWPGMMRTLYGEHDRFKEVYFTKFPGFYFTGDGARRDEDGYYWITGRIDDVINVSGHRLGTAEVESALQSHPTVAEAAVVGYPHEIKGQGIYAYVILNAGVKKTAELEKELIIHVRREIGPIAAPDVVHCVDGLPKTRSGKIMRRILRKMATREWDQIGDTSTLADPSVVDQLIQSCRESAVTEPGRSETSAARNPTGK